MQRHDGGNRGRLILVLALIVVAGLLVGALVAVLRRAARISRQETTIHIPEARIVSGKIPGTMPAGTSRPAGPVWQVRVTKAGYEFDGKTYGRDDAIAVAADMKRAAGNLSEPVVILPAAEVKWPRVVEMFNQIKKAGFTKIGFAQSLADEPAEAETQPEAPRS